MLNNVGILRVVCAQVNSERSEHLISEVFHFSLSLTPVQSVMCIPTYFYRIFYIFEMHMYCKTRSNCSHTRKSQTMRKEHLFFLYIKKY